MRRVTIDDVAREAGVSRQTVSRAINHKRDISPETRARVLHVVQQLGFRPNRVAQSMITQRTYTIGVEVTDITNPVFAEMVRGVQETAAAHDYNLLLANSNDDPHIALQSLSTLTTHGIDGLIAMFPNVSDDDILAFADTYRPIVLLNRTVPFHPNISTVTINIKDATTMAVESLIQQGHTRFGMIANLAHVHSKQRRVNTYRKIIQRHQLQGCDRIWYASPTFEGGYKATGELLNAYPDITAIFGYNDLMAVGAIRACLDIGRHVPKEIAIIGFDDIPLARFTTPSLTTIQYDKFQLGQQSMFRLLNMIENPESHFPILEIAVKLVERESTSSAISGV